MTPEEKGAQLAKGPLGWLIVGALFAGSVSSSGTLLIDYDVAVLQSNQACAAFSPATCSRCDDCGSAATCTLGTCGACATDADCCFPLVCSLGECVPLHTGD